jgi:hypothetical protein
LKGNYSDLPAFIFFPEVFDNVNNWVKFFKDNRVRLNLIRLLIIEMSIFWIRETLETPINMKASIWNNKLMMLQDLCMKTSSPLPLWEDTEPGPNWLWPLDVTMPTELLVNQSKIRCGLFRRRTLGSQILWSLLRNEGLCQWTEFNE